jgi:hypothetical protein
MIQTTESHLLRPHPRPLPPRPRLLPLPPPSELSQELLLEDPPTEDEEATRPEEEGTRMSLETLVPPAPRAFPRDSSTPLALTASEFVSMTYLIAYMSADPQLPPRRTTEDLMPTPRAQGRTDLSRT